MEIKTEKKLFWFEFWSGAKDNASQLNYEEFEQLETILEEIADSRGEIFEETEINDLFWFEFETICDWLGLKLNEYGNIIRN